MSMYIHHVEIGVQNGLKVLERFTKQFQFACISTRNTTFSQQWLVKKGHVQFLITQADADSDKFKRCSDVDRYISNWSLIYDKRHGKTQINENLLKIDSVFNVALEVNCVEKFVDHFAENGGLVIKPTSKVRDENGSVDIAVVKSCIGNVVHTLVNTSGYTGTFLPEFEDCVLDSGDDKCDDRFPVAITHLDHVAYVCEKGSSDAVIYWYERFFGLTRFFMNKEETDSDGLVVELGGMGLRLKAMEYHACVETELHGDKNEKDGGIKFVIAESLNDKGSDQVNKFLGEHYGEGVQHIGLHTPDIVSTVSSLQHRHVEFAEPPFTYYTELGKLKEITDLGEDGKHLQKHGILVDSEADSHEAERDTFKHDANQSIRYLMQKFTKPLFDRETFFLEFIQRKGATGFGAGNISALWQSVQTYLNGKYSESRNN